MTGLTILYTGQIRGNLQMLPRLYTFLQALKQKHGNNALLLDIGDACADDVWHCAASSGRSAVIVLDGMGYHAVNVSGHMTDSVRDSLRGTLMVGLVTARHMWRYFVPPTRDEDIVVAGQATPAMRLCIVASPAKETRLESRMLHLQAVKGGDVGMVQIDLGSQVIARDAVFSMPAGTKPDATIAASVELVEEEARMAQKRR